MTTEQICREFLAKAKHLKPYIYHKAITTNSIYVKFESDSLRSLRISGHTGKSLYKYRWNLRHDVGDFYYTKDRGVVRLFFPPSQMDEMIELMTKLQHIEVLQLSDVKNSLQPTRNNLKGF